MKRGSIKESNVRSGNVVNAHKTNTHPTKLRLLDAPIVGEKSAVGNLTVLSNGGQVDSDIPTNQPAPNNGQGLKPTPTSSAPTGNIIDRVQRQSFLAPQNPNVQLNHFTIGGRRFIIKSVPASQFVPQQPFFPPGPFQPSAQAQLPPLNRLTSIEHSPS